VIVFETLRRSQETTPGSPLFAILLLILLLISIAILIDTIWNG